MAEHILVVEDELAQRAIVGRILRKQGYQVSEASSAEEALEKLDRQSVDLIISDWKLGGMDGMELLGRVKDQCPETSFIMITAYGTVTHAMEAVRAGADDYLEKPFERGSLLLALERTLKSKRLHDENQRMAAELTQRDRLVDLIGRSAAMQKIFRAVEKVANTVATVLITGESGTGKELAARALHALSTRKNGPFIAVNCAAIPEGLLESEFFGVEKGAYSGAHQSRKGKFQAAEKGTLFLDEIGELPLTLQSKLLRVLQEKTVTPVGSVEEIKTDARILAATNKDLAGLAGDGAFREDLFYRLNVVSLDMPPLRDRREDISSLITHFTEQAAKAHGVVKPSFPPALKRRLLDHSWPGNVRELSNTIERLVLLAEDGHASLEDMPPALGRKSEDRYELPPEGLNWEGHEKACLQQAIEMTRGNRSRAAKLLSMPYKAFLYRLEKHGLKPN